MYGLTVGQLDGLILGYFRGFMVEHLLIRNQEKLEEIVEAYAEQVRALVNQLKTKSGAM